MFLRRDPRVSGRDKGQNGRFETSMDFLDLPVPAPPVKHRSVVIDRTRMTMTSRQPDTAGGLGQESRDGRLRT